MQNKNHAMEQLWLKSVMGLATSQEEQQVHQWAEEHPIEIAAFKQKWANRTMDIVDYDSHTALEHIRHRLPSSPRRISPLYTWTGIAASLLFLIGYVVNSNYSKPSIIESFGKETVVTLPDQSRVTLVGKSKIIYDKNFGKEDRVVAIEGKAFFDIKRDTTKKFIVNDDRYQVEVLGTSYLIDETKADIDLHVASGRVKVAVGQSSKVLTHGQRVSIHDGVLSEVYGTDDALLEAYTGKFEFKNEKLINVIARLNPYYKSIFVLDSSIGSNECRLNTRIDRLAAAKVAEIISLACNVTFQESNGVYIIRSKN